MWRTIEAQAESLSPRDRKLLAGMAFFFGLVGLLVFCGTLLSLQRSLDDQVVKAELALGDLQTQQVAYDIANAQLTAQKERVKQHTGTALSAHVEKIAQDLGVSEGLRDAPRSETITENGVAMTKWKVTLKGRSYEEAMRFLIALESSDYPVRVEITRLKQVNVKREIAVDLTLDVITFKLEES